MKILRIIYDWPDKNVITAGLAPAPYGLSVAQANLNHTIYVLCGNLNGKNIKELKFKYTLEGGKITVYNLPRGLKRFGPFLTTSFFVLPYYFYLKFTKKIDIVHNHGHLGVWFLFYKKLFKWLDKTPVLGHIHITAKGREQKIKEQGVRLDFWTKYFEYPLHKLSDLLTKDVAFHTVTVSKDNIEELVSLYGYDPKKISLLESAVDIYRFKKEGEKVDLGLNNNYIKLINIGRLSKRKNIDILVSSLKFLPKNYVLFLIGFWDLKFKPLVTDIIRKNNLTDRVKYLGPKSYFEIDKYFRSADIFVLPSSYEGLPKVIIEALACGEKCVASGFSIDKKIPNLYFIEQLNPELLAKKILEASKNPNEYKKTRQIIEKYYSWDSKAKDLESIYKKMIK